MKNKLCLLVLVSFCVPVMLFAGGISVNAGLTPAQDRFILRTQYRYMSMSNSMMTTSTHMTPLVLAYGITSGFSLMVRGMYVYKSFSNNTEVNNGLNDLYLLSKFRLYRKNTANYVLGIAPHIASNVPIGSTAISNRTWNPEIGLNISYRPRFFAVDVSITYTFTDITEKSKTSSGNIYNLNTAFSALIPLKNNSSDAISPVLELSYIHQGHRNNAPSLSSDIVFISPGVSYIHSSLVLEALVQFPVYQTEEVNIMNQKSRLILGVKYMF